MKATQAVNIVDIVADEDPSGQSLLLDGDTSGETDKESQEYKRD